MRAKSAKLLYVKIDVDEITFNKGYFTVDLRYFYKVRGEAYSLVNRPADISGLCIFDKRVILFGSEGSAKVFSSVMALGGLDARTIETSNMPIAVCESVDPIVLNMKLVEICGCQPGDPGIGDVPPFVEQTFGTELLLDPSDRRVLVTLGQFSIVRLERDTQLLIPSYDYCMPNKECIGSNEEDPCTLFSRIRFPVDEFFPPDSLDTPDGYRETRETNNPEE